MIISLIVAMDKNRVIGKNNALPWHLPADLKHFKKITMGKSIIMGRKTHESIGKPLPGRRNIVISQQHGLRLSGCEVFHSVEDALRALEHEQEVLIIGGASVFTQTLSKADCLYLTIINHAVEGDAYFPVWESQNWQEVARESHEPDTRNPYPYDFLTLKRSLVSKSIPVNS